MCPGLSSHLWTGFASFSVSAMHSGHVGPADRGNWVPWSPGPSSPLIRAGSSSPEGTQPNPPPAAAAAVAAATGLFRSPPPAQCSVAHALIGAQGRGVNSSWRAQGFFQRTSVKLSLEKEIRTPPADQRKRVFLVEQKGDVKRHEKVQLKQEGRAWQRRNCRQDC